MFRRLRLRYAGRPGPILVLAGLAFLVPSCGGRNPVYPVHGRVLDGRGKPAAGALVIFHPSGSDNPGTLNPVGRVDSAGDFRLTTYTEGDGAPAGAYAVTITWPTPRKTPFGREGPDQLRGSYSDPRAAKIHFEVEKRPDNEVPVIKLP
jgi:hypothetical protein